MTTKEPKILIFYSNPGNLPGLRLDKEYRAVDQVLRDASLVKRLHATTVDDLSRALMEREYEIVQFSGHGVEEGIFLEDRNLQKNMFVPAGQIARILHQTSPHLKAAIFMACYSADSIPELVDSAPYLVTVTGPADDETAIDFIAQFYNAYLHYGLIEKAFNIAQNYVALIQKDTVLNVSLSRRAIVNGKNQILFRVFPSGKDESVLIDLTEAEADIAALNISRGAFLGMLSRKIRIHRWIFNAPRQRAVLSLGPYFGLFSWEDANDVVFCNRILRIKSDIDERTCEAWASLIVAYNDHYMDRYRMIPETHITFLNNSLGEYRKTYESYFDTGDKAGLLRNATPEQFKVTKAIVSANLDQAENKFRQEDYDATIIYLETALSAIHDLVEDLTNILTT